MKFLDGFLNVVWHLYFYMIFLVIPLDGECTIQFLFPIYCYFLQLLNFLEDILCMLLSNKVYAKVTNNEIEGDGYGLWAKIPGVDFTVWYP